MSTHSQVAPPPAPIRGVGFLHTWQQLLGPAPGPAVPRRRGRPARVPFGDVLAAVTYHVVQGSGTLAQHFTQLFGTTWADSSWSDRRQRLPWDLFAELMRRVLQPRATPAHADAFWRGWRLVALDGTQFSVINTPQVRATHRKVSSRRGRAAFVKLIAAVVVELGLHNPVAAAIGRDGESEWALAGRALAALPPEALLLGDRLYGCAAFATHALAACQRVGSHFLFRARRLIKPEVQRTLIDGSRLIRVPVRDPEHAHRILAWLSLREIRVRVGRPGHRGQALRLWTSLLDPTTAPAQELAELYARRWEHELYFREIKRQLRHTAVLQSHTAHTAAQEIAAIVLASAVLAHERLTAAGDAVAPLRISFAKLLQGTQSMYVTIAVSDGVITEDQLQTLMTRSYAVLRTYVTPTRRTRSCPRKVRQPIKRWPRLMRNESVEGPFHVEIL